MVFLVHMVIGYTDLFYKFEYLENALALVERLKLGIVKELSDDVEIKITIEALSENEYNEKIKKTEEK